MTNLFVLFVGVILRLLYFFCFFFYCFVFFPPGWWGLSEPKLLKVAARVDHKCFLDMGCLVEMVVPT